MPIWIATTPPGTVPAATIRMKSQPASSVAVPAAGTMRRASAAGPPGWLFDLNDGQSGSPRARRLPKHCVAAWSATARVAPTPETQEICGRDVAGVPAEPAGDHQECRGDEPEVLDRGGGRGRAPKWPRAFWAAARDGDDPVEPRPCGSTRKSSTRALGLRVRGRDVTVNPERQQVHDQRRHRDHRDRGRGQLSMHHADVARPACAAR